MFSDELNKLRMPASYSFGTNVYIDSERSSFFWNETNSIVELNPYDGRFRIVMNEEKVGKNMPFIDRYRECYAFFDSFNNQKGLYIESFPNFNNIAGTVMAIYDSDQNFLGNIICTEDHISFSDDENRELSRFDDANLLPLIYAP